MPFGRIEDLELPTPIGPGECRLRAQGSHRSATVEAAAIFGESGLRWRAAGGADLRPRPLPARVQPRRFLARAGDVFRIAAAVLVDALGGQLQHAVGQAGQEVAVMGDEERGASVIAKHMPPKPGHALADEDGPGRQGGGLHPHQDHLVSAAKVDDGVGA
jgi:hypothetical protein